ncbi:hypothetical protein HALDL1_10780 [Halobacterium sp. DL1]|jgi:hypothetical protein|nr:hypothetical protein HALDL1_10780 [Halobacterium sp. DL1]
MTTNAYALDERTDASGETNGGSPGGWPDGSAPGSRRRADDGMVD